MEKSIHAPKKWQPQHCPIGSTVVYKTGFASEGTFLTVEVTGHVYNAVDSWVFETNRQCPIFPDDPEKFASANGDHIIAVLERGNGGFTFNRAAAELRAVYREDYERRIGNNSIAHYKGKHEYIAYDLRALVTHAIYFNDELFHQFSGSQHRYRFNDKFFEGLLDLVERKGTMGFVLTANKRKLVKRIKRLLPLARIAKKALLKEEAEWEREVYERDMGLMYGGD